MKYTLVKLVFQSIPFLILGVLIWLVVMAARKRTVFWIAAAAMASLTLAVGFYNCLKIPDVHEVEIDFENLPAELVGYRIVQLTDLHVSSLARRWRTEGIVKRANELQADLICVTGDLVDGSPEVRGRDLEPIRDLTAKDGVYFVTGNHEFYGDRAGWKRLFDAWGLKFLANTCVKPRPSLALGGVNDLVAHRTRERLPVPAKCYLTATNDEFRILLSHRPAQARDNVKASKVDLQLSGHTHGGMVPFLEKFVAKMNGGFSRGLYRLGKGVLYLSPGTGQWAGFPFRLFNPAEITLIILK